MASVLGPGKPTGYGLDTRAAYGGGGTPTVYKVTSLADDGGTGTLRYGCEAAGNRVIIFEISGHIDLNNDLIINNPYITIAGQTAPSPGICVRNFGLQIGAHDVLVQHLAIRPGGDTCNSGCQVYGGNQYNIVFDHVSFTWGQDENLAFNWTNGQQTDATVYRCIMAEGLYRTPGSDGCSGGGASNGHGILVAAETGRLAIIQSVFANNFERNPYMQGGTNTAIINNVIYQWHGPWGIFLNNANVSSDGHTGAWHTNVQGNRFIKGPNTTDGSDPNAYLFVYSINSFGESAGNTIYKSDNTIANPDGTIITETNQYSYDPNVGSVPSQAPTPGALTVLGSAGIEASVLANAGCRPAQRQVVDTRIINDVTSRGGGFISHPNDVGGYPTLAVGTRPLTVPSSPHVVQASGYTTLEEWLQGYADTVEGEVVSSVPDAEGTTFYQDTFTGPTGQNVLSHAGEINATYVNATGVTGQFAITNFGRLRSNSSGSLATVVAAGIPLSTQYDVVYDLYQADLPPGRAMAVWVKFDPVTFTGYQLRYDTDNVSFELYRADSNVFTLLGTYPYGLTPSTNTNVRFKTRSTGQYVVVDGINAISSTDVGITGIGRVALSTFTNAADSDAGGIHLDNVFGIDVISAAGTALHGVQATGQLGAVGKNITKALTGVSATTALGTIGKARSVAITGLVGMGLLGVFGNTNVSVGVSAQVQLGNLGFIRSVALNGVQATASTGAVGVTQLNQASLTGVAGTTATGLLVPARTKALTGLSATGAVGTVSTGSANTVALTGVQATTALGTVRPPADVSVALTGVVGRTSLNSLTPPGFSFVDPITNSVKTVVNDILTIAGVQRTIINAWSVTDAQNNSGTMRFNISSEDGTYVPDYDDEVIFIQNTKRIFAGFVSTFRIRGAGDEGGVPLFTEVTCVDYNSLATRRYYHEMLLAGSLKSMLNLIVPYCPGVTMDPALLTGPTLEDADYKGWKIVDILNQLTQRTGWIWNIDYYKVFHMYSPGFVTAPFSITSGNGLAKGDVTVEPSRREYANRIIVYGKGVVASDQDNTQIEKYGYYELAYSSEETTDPVALKAIATTILSQTLVVLRTAKYVTYEDGIAAGQTQQITLAGRKVNNTFLLTEVVSTYVAPHVVKKSVTAIEGLVFKAGWRETYKGWGGAGAGATGIGSSSGGGVTQQALRPVYNVGGNGIEATRNDTGVAWIPAAGGDQRIGFSSVQPRINTVTRSGSGSDGTDAIVYVRMRAFTPGVTVTARLYDVTTGQFCPGASATVNNTNWETVSFGTVLTPGFHYYELLLLPSVAGADVQATGYVE